MDNSVVSIGRTTLGGVWVFLALALLAATLAAAPPAFGQDGTDCVGERDGLTVTLAFDGSIGTSVQLLRDGRWRATVTDLTSFSDQSATGTSYVLRVRDRGDSFDARCVITEEGDLGVGPATCRIVEGDPNLLEFSGELGSSAQLRRNGSWVATVTGLTSFEVEEIDGYELRVRGGRFDGDVTCSTDPTPPTPQPLACTYERTGSAVAFTFDSTISDSLQLRRDGRWLATVSGTTSFTDTSTAGTIYVLRANFAGGEREDFVCASDTIEPPVNDGAPTCTVNAEGTLLTFSGDLGVDNQLRREGVWVATVTGETSFPADGTDGYTLRVRGGTAPGDVDCTLGGDEPPPPADPDPGGPGIVDAVATIQSGCSSELSLLASANQTVLAQGETTSFNASVRNNPVGSCFAAGDTPASVSGTLEVAATDAAVNLETIVMWIEVPGNGVTVLPAAAGLTTSGLNDASGCPGGSIAGCGLETGATTGVNTSAVVEQTINPGGTLSLPFTFFPQLAAADVALIEGLGPDAITLAAALLDDAGGIEIVRTAIDFADATATQAGSVTGTFPDGAQSASFGAINPGEQDNLDDIFAFTPANDTADVVNVTFQATSGGLSSNIVETTIIVTINDDGLPVLQPAVGPAAVTVGETTTLSVSVLPQEELAGAPTVSALGTSTALNDDGINGDLVAGDGVFSAEFDFTPATTGEATVSLSATSAAGGTLAGQSAVLVVPENVPTSNETGVPLNIVEQDGSEFLADRLLLFVVDDFDASLLADLVAPIGGTIVGFVGPGVWQVAIPEVEDLDGFGEIASVLAGQPGIINIEPEFLGVFDSVEPADNRFDEQTNITEFGLDEAWAFENGSSNPVTIAVLDAGFNTTHPDLNDVLLDGIDISDGDLDVNTPTCDHGTRVAGIIGAETSNGIGIAGVNWDAQILPVKVFPTPTASGCGRWRHADLATGIDFAVMEGARVLNMSLSSSNRTEVVAKALDRATSMNRILVATSGNTFDQQRRYPSGFERVETFDSRLEFLPGFSDRVYSIDILSVGSVEDDSTRSDFSTTGPWVDIVAPGRDVLSTELGTSYSTDFGTSFAAPFVAGVASLMASQDPTITPAEVRARLIETGIDTGDPNHGPIIDPFEAIVNGSFEARDNPWAETGTVLITSGLGTIRPFAGDSMLALSTGPGAANDRSTASIMMNVPGNRLENDEITINLWYNYVTDEFPEFVGTQFNDLFTVDIILPDGTRRNVVNESVNTTNFTPLTGVELVGGDDTVGELGWRFESITIAGADLDGGGEIMILVEDAGDSVFDSIALIDAVSVS